MVLEIKPGKAIAAVLAVVSTLGTGGVGFAVHQEGRMSTVEAKVDAQKRTLDDTNQMVKEMYSHLLSKQRG